VTIVAAELVAANNGLGRMIWDSRMYMLVDQIFVALVVLGFLGFTADRLFRWGIYAFAGRFSPDLGSLEWLEGSHLFPMERPIETARALQRMLNSLKAAEGGVPRDSVALAKRA